MTKYIKQNKIYSTPILIEKNSQKIYTDNQQLILAQGYTKYQVPTKSVQTLIKQSVLQINAETDKKILNDFVYNQNEFYLTMQNQQNFANMFVAKEFLTYPITIKTKTGYTQLANQEEVTMFYLSGINYVKQCLEQGWAKKAAAEEQIRTNNA